MPKRVMRKIERIQRWGKREGSGKIASVKWDKVCLPKEDGGLGVKNIRIFNTALLAKWRWSFFFYLN